MRKFSRRVDSDQSAIVARLRAAGYSVLSLSGIGKGCPDLLVGKDGVNYLCEVKASTGKLTPEQEQFFTQWQGSVTILTLEFLEALLKK
jgi:Holliday junction resolvase